MLVIEEVFSQSYYMLYQRHIDQNIYGRLLNMGIEEKGASMCINITWHNLINSFDLMEYEDTLNKVKTKWHKRLDFLHYLEICASLDW